MSFFLSGWKQPVVLLFLLGTVLLLVMLAVHADETSTEPPEKVPRHTLFQKEVEAKTISFSEGPYVCKTYDDKREFCGCETEPKLDAFHYPKADLNCPKNFFKVAMMAMCGNVWFDQIKYCSIATFFKGHKEPTLDGENKDYNRALLLIDGCLTYKDKDCQITELKVTHYEADGDSFWSNCVEEPEAQDFHAEGLKIAVPKGDGNVTLETAAFTVPVVVSHRICKNLFSSKGPEDVYKDLKLHITHNCGEGGVEVVKLPDLNLAETENNVMELRGLWVDLNTKERKQYRLNEAVTDTVQYKINEPDDLKWEKPNLGCWYKEGTTNCPFAKKEN